MLVHKNYVLKTRGWVDKPQECYYGGQKDRGYADMVDIDHAVQFETKEQAENLASQFRITMDAVQVGSIVR